MSNKKIENSRKYFTQAISKLNNINSIKSVQEAIALFNKSNKRMGDKHIPCLNGLAACYTELHQLERSKNIYEKNIQMARNDITTINSYINYSERVGEISNAIGLYKILIEKFPPSINTVHSLVKLDESQTDIKILEQFDISKFTQENMIKYYLTLAILHERTDNYKKAWLYYYKSNQRLFNFPMVTLMMDEYRKTFKDVRSKIKEDKFNIIDNDVELVFIIGCPKSGINLVNSLLTESSELYATDVCLDIGGILDKYKKNEEEDDIEELGNIKSIPEVDQSEENKNKENVTIDSDEIFSKLYQDIKTVYENSDTKYNKKVKYFIQSCQDVNLYTGALYNIFSKVKFIHCERDKKDMALSIYMSDKYDQSMNWTTNMMSIINYIKFNDELLSVWNIPEDDIITVKYEELVNNPNQVMGSVFDFLGVDKCQVDFAYQQNRYYRTENISKLKKKIYTTSVGKFKKLRAVCIRIIFV